jgi:hypothetical protein
MGGPFYSLRSAKTRTFYFQIRVKRAEQIVQKQQLVDDLQQMISRSGADASQEATLRNALKAAQADVKWFSYRGK